MKKLFCTLLLTGTMTAVSFAEGPVRPPESPDGPMPRKNFASSPEFQAMRQRRQEIGTLVRAYQLMPEEGRPALKKEILRRIAEDFREGRRHMDKMIADMEKHLAELKAKQAQEADVDALAEKEFEKLLTLPPPQTPAPRR